MREGWLESAAVLLLLTVLFDAYPVMLQRFNRARLPRLARRPPGRVAGGLIRHDIKYRMGQDGAGGE